jgi:hypothetical protein
MPSRSLDELATVPVAINANNFNNNCRLPYGLTTDAVQLAMADFLQFIGVINGQLYRTALPRLETILMSANFSSIVGEFMTVGIPKYAPTLVKNRYHNGHPDLIPAGTFRDDSVQHDSRGIEVKASRYGKSWQGHNAESVFLMVFVFRSNRASDEQKKVKPMPFGFVEVLGAQLEKSDWLFAGRSATSRRTITASVTKTGYGKMAANWIYRDRHLLAGTVATPEPELTAIVEELAGRAEEL